MKGKVLVIAAVIAILACIASGTAAYFTKESTAANVITTGSVGLEIVELTKDNTVFPESGVVVLPGATVSKIVSVKNTSNQPMFIRIQLSKLVNNADLQNDFMDKGILTTDFNDKDWTVGEDGFVYYNRILAGGEETEPVITEVYIDGPNTDNKYRGMEFTLKVDAYGVQSANNGNEPLSAVGWSDASDVNKETVFVPSVQEKGGDN